MKKVEVLVVEDESIVAKDIQQSLEKLGYKVLGNAPTGENAITLAYEKKPDIVLMDIMLKGEYTGIEAAEKIKTGLNIPVIYLTAYADDATLEKAKVTEPYGYIIKPFKEVDLHTSIEMALYKADREKEVQKERDLLYSLVDNTNEFVFVRSRTGLMKLRTRDIQYIEALKDYVVINTADTRYTIHSTMKDIEKHFSSDQFLRVHRSYIVRLDMIKKIEQGSIIMEKGKKAIPIGGSYKDALMKRIDLI